MDDEILIMAIELRPAIYDKNEKLHFNRDYIAQQWKAIAEEVQADVERCKTRWGHIRDYFLKKYRQIQNGQIAAGKRKWHLYDTLSFLIPVYQPREITGNMMDGSDTLEPDFTDTDTKDTDTMISRTPSSMSPTPDSPPYAVSSYKRRCPTRTRKQFTASASEMDNTEALSLKTLQYSDDDDELWARSIIPSMKKLEHLEKLEFRLEVQTLLLQYLRRQEELGAKSSFTSSPGPSQENCSQGVL